MLNDMKIHFLSKYMKQLKLIIAALFLISPIAANAAIIYEVDLAIGQGTVVGTITTNGVQGDVYDSDITAFSLNLFDGVDSFALNGSYVCCGPNNGGRALGLLTATMTELLFDFSFTGGGGALSFVSGNNYFILQNGNSAANGDVSVELAEPGNPNIPSRNVQRVSDLQGIYVIGSVASVPDPTPNPIPEPGTLALLGLGLAGIGIRRRKK